MITKGERTELRSLVRQQFKVLREEVQQRRAEVTTDAQRQIDAVYADQDAAWAAAADQALGLAWHLDSDVHRLAVVVAEARSPRSTPP